MHTRCMDFFKRLQIEGAISVLVFFGHPVSWKHITHATPSETFLQTKLSGQKRTLTRPLGKRRHFKTNMVMCPGSNLGLFMTMSNTETLSKWWGSFIGLVVCLYALDIVCLFLFILYLLDCSWVGLYVFLSLYVTWSREMSHMSIMFNFEFSI